ncbi:MAG: peptide chain release factor 2 [Clostridiales bacterium]|nr:peptide chain release factor 2 [Candidatus Apopatousia equi]
MNKELEELKHKQENDDFWKDLKQVEVVSRRVKQIENKIETFSKLESDFNNLKDFCELLQVEDDENLFKTFCDELDKLVEKTENVYLTTLLKGKYDGLNAILTIHSGAGGTESQDWAEMLYRMYTRYCERSDYKINVLDIQDGDDAGIKSVSFLVSGENAYGYLKSEKGVHRLVRISPFDANSRRHTSFASVEVVPEIINDDEIKVNPDDIRIDTYRSSGAGGQHINKTDSAIRITHYPTGIVVACQTERSQLQNKENAFKMLYSKLAELKEQEEQAKLKNIQGDLKKIEWGSQIRSYVFCPYTMVKDHRTDYETANIQQVMDGDLQPFINEYLKKSN